MPSLRNTTVLGALVVGALVASCGDVAKLPQPTPTGDDPRGYGFIPCPALPAEKKPRVGAPESFAALYADLFAVKGSAAQCQNKACHGRLDDAGNPLGQSGLKMDADTVAESPGAPSGNPAGVYCGLTKHKYGERFVVDTSKPAYEKTSADGSKVCCESGDRLYRAVDCAGAANAKTEGDCASGTGCVKALCRTDAILGVLDPKDGFMPNPLSCNRKLLPSELDRIFAWLKSGAHYDGFGDAVTAPKCNADGLVCGTAPANRTCD